MRRGTSVTSIIYYTHNYIYIYVIDDDDNVDNNVVYIGNPNYLYVY